MANIKPLIIVLTVFFILGIIINLMIAPFVDLSNPQNDSILYKFNTFVEDGYNITIDVPIFPDFESNIKPVQWLWLGIDPITDFMVTNLNFLTVFDDRYIVPFVIIVALVFAWTLLTLLRGN